jgi:peptidoglycan/LPS O-acetylase OafA/YrhL
MVFAQHYIHLPWGWSGVNAFFVLSGFLITGILFDTRDDPQRARNFYVRRTLRIFPLYYGIFLLALITTPIFHWLWSSAWVAWPLYIGNFLRFWGPSASKVGSTLQLAADAQLHARHFPLILFLGHFWSLCVEEQFYLLWPWIVFFVRSRRALVWVCGLTVLVTPLARVIAQHQAPSWMLDLELLYRVTPFQLDSLLLGGVLALLWRGAHRAQLLAIARYVLVISSVLVIFYVVFIIHTCFPEFAKHFRYPAWRLTWGLTLINIYSAALLLSALRPGSFVFRLFSLRPLRWVGRISYGAYVFHDILHQACFDLVFRAVHHFHRLRNVSDGVSWSMAVLFSLVCTLLLAHLSFRFFESPFLKLKERLTIRSTTFRTRRLA